MLSLAKLILSPIHFCYNIYVSKIKLPTTIIWPLTILIIALGAFYFKPWQTKPSETISVTAEGKADATPNVATVTATIESKNPNLDTARAQNEQKVAKIINKLKEVGVNEKDIKTQAISGSPGYEILPDGSQVQTQIYPAPPRPNTNNFSTSLEITIRNFDLSDEILKILTQNGATNLYGPNLTLDEEAQNLAKSKAREKAVTQARTKAEELAKLSARKLGKVASIAEEGNVIFPQPLLAISELDLKQKATQIMPGQNEVSVTIQVGFELK